MLRITDGEAEGALPEGGMAGPAEAQNPGPAAVAATEVLPAAQTVNRVRRTGLPAAGPADLLHGRKHDLLRPAAEEGELLPDRPPRAEDGDRQAAPRLMDR